MDFVPYIPRDNGVMLPWVNLVLVRHIPYIDRIIEDAINITWRYERSMPLFTPLRDECFCSDASFPQFSCQGRHGFEGNKARKNMLDDLGFFSVDMEMAVFDVISQRRVTAHPHIKNPQRIPALNPASRATRKVAKRVAPISKLTLNSSWRGSSPSGRVTVKSACRLSVHFCAASWSMHCAVTSTPYPARQG